MEGPKIPLLANWTVEIESTGLPPEDIKGWFVLPEGHELVTWKEGDVTFYEARPKAQKETGNG